MTIASRLARTLGLVVAVALLLPAGVLAAPPEHAPAAPADLLLPGGDYCEHDVVLSTPTHRLHDTSYAPLPDGTVRFAERGMAATRATDQTTGAVLDTRGGSSLVLRFAADGSLVATGTGWFFAWYLPGDDAELGPGVFLLHGKIQETYDANGTFVKSTFSGNSTDVCEALGD